MAYIVIAVAPSIGVVMAYKLMAYIVMAVAPSIGVCVPSFVCVCQHSSTCVWIGVQACAWTWPCMVACVHNYIGITK